MGFKVKNGRLTCIFKAGKYKRRVQGTKDVKKAVKRARTKLK